MRVSGGSPYFSTKMRSEGPKKIFLETRPPPSLRAWMTEPPLPLLLSEGLDPPLKVFVFEAGRLQ